MKSLQPSSSHTIWLLSGFMMLLMVASSFWACQSQDPTLPKTVDFNFHIRPILSEKCYVCHGPDSSTREGGVRLDNYEAAIAKLEDGGAAIVPGSPEKSLLLKRIMSHDPEEVMPPPESKKSLNDREIALLERWIKQGAKWKKYWAFIPPSTPDIPRRLRNASPNQTIDYFIEKGWDSHGVQPAPLANNATLIRRVAYLLTGLPPTQEELQQFEADNSEDVYEKIIDHYLESPHFGERWARHWMDLVRYGESMGHEMDFDISHPWEYRDYLIRAFNQDVPYDLFVKEHLAGDMLSPPRYHPEEGFNESIIGTGYFFLGEGKHSPVNHKQEEADKIDNMIDVTSKTFLGLTVACARCHDHKFDPIPTADYYAMYGMLESARLGPHPARRGLKQELQLAEVQAIKQKIREEIGQQLGQQIVDHTSRQSMAQQVKLIKPETPNISIPSDVKIIGDFRGGDWKGWYNTGYAFGDSPLMGEPVFDSVSHTFQGLRSGFASSRALGPGVHGVLRSPNFLLETDSIAIRAAGHNGMIRIVVDNFQVIQNPLWGSLEMVVNDPEFKTYTLDVSLAKGHKAYLQFMPGKYKRHEYHIEPEDYIEVQYAYIFQNQHPVIPAPSFPEFATGDQAAKMQAVQQWIQDQATPSQVQFLHLLTQQATPLSPSDSLTHWLYSLNTLTSQLYDSTHFIGMAEGEAVFSPIFIRGSINNLSEEKMPRQFLSVLEASSDSFSQEGSGRLAWAEAVVAPHNPLTSRIIVNRIWHHLFGRGIVETVDNFGLQGKLPTHPELLDYLALLMQKEGWSMKRMIKHIMMSHTFQRSTQALEANLPHDPNNLYLHHFPLRRLEAEAIRDGILATSGSLDPTMYGTPVPVHLTRFMTGRGRPWKSGPLDGAGRRSIYTSVRRNFLPPMMLAFDMPIPFSTFGRRNTTNVPAQSLTLMNDPFVKEQALCWAERLLHDHPKISPEDRIQIIYREAFAREASPSEIQTAIGFLENQAKILEGDMEDMKQDAQLWAAYCHAVFNLKEFIHLL